MSDNQMSSAAEMLKNARLERDWTLEQVSLQTKIPKEMIAALEERHLAALPGAPYARAFCQTLAKAYELDPDAVLVGLRVDMGLGPIQHRPGKSQLELHVDTPSEEKARNRTPLIIAFILALSLLIVIAATRLVFQGGSGLRTPEDSLRSQSPAIDTVGADTMRPIRPVPPPAPATSVASTRTVSIANPDTSGSVFLLYIRQGVNKVRRKTLTRTDSLDFDPDTAIMIRNLSHRNLRIGGALRRDTVLETCFRILRKSDSVRFVKVEESEWDKTSDGIKRLKKHKEP